MKRIKLPRAKRLVGRALSRITRSIEAAGGSLASCRLFQRTRFQRIRRSLGYAPAVEKKDRPAQ